MNNTNGDSKKRELKNTNIPKYIVVFILISGTLFSTIVAEYLRRKDIETQKNEFIIESGKMAEAIGEEFKIMQAQIDSVGDFCSIIEEVTYSNFKKFLSYILKRNYSFLGISWDQMVLKEDRDSFEKNINAQGLKDFSIFEINSMNEKVRPRDKPFYVPVTFIEPIEENKEAVGFDVSSSPTRWSSFQQAANTGRIIYSPKISLVQTNNAPKGTLIIYPVYLPGSSPPYSLEKIKGFVVGPVLIKDTVNKALQFFTNTLIYIYIFDTSTDNGGALLYSSLGEEHILKKELLDQHPLSLTYTLNLGDRTWEIVAIPDRVLLGASSLPLIIWAIGVIITILLAVVGQYITLRIQQQASIQALEGLVDIQLQEVKNAKDYAEAALEALKRKSAEERIISQQKIEALGTVASGVAHSIRNPLNFVINFAELSHDLLLELLNKIKNTKEPISPEFSESLQENLRNLTSNVQSIQESGNKAEAIVESLEQHARMRGGEKESMPLASLMQGAIENAFFQIRKIYPQFTCEVISQVYDLYAYVIPQHAERGFVSLILNSFYSLQEKREFDKNFTPNVTIKAKYLEEYIQISIYDNGKGMSDFVKKQLFIPLFTTRPPGKGLGLGLSLAFSIFVQEHKGSIEVKSKEGEYAEFIVTLPKESSNSAEKS